MRRERSRRMRPQAKAISRSRTVAPTGFLAGLVSTDDLRNAMQGFAGRDDDDGGGGEIRTHDSRVCGEFDLIMATETCARIKKLTAFLELESVTRICGGFHCENH